MTVVCYGQHGLPIRYSHARVGWVACGLSLPRLGLRMKTTAYFRTVRSRRDRELIKDEWILRVMREPEREMVQDDGRIRRWGRIQDAGGRYLRVVLLSDGEAVHNALFDRGFKP